RGRAFEAFKRRRVADFDVVQRRVAFVGRRERVFDFLTDFRVLRRVEVVALAQAELGALFGEDRVFGVGRAGLGALRAGGVLEGPVVEVGLGDLVDAGADDRFARGQFGGR